MPRLVVLLHFLGETLGLREGAGGDGCAGGAPVVAACGDTACVPAAGGGASEVGAVALGHPIA